MISWYRRQSPGRRVFWMLAAILAAVIAANAPSLCRAVDSWSGPGALPDEAGRRQNPDWLVYVAFAPAGPRSGKVDVWASSAEGSWIAGAEARARFVHSTQAGREFEIALPPRAPGNYGAKVELPLGGQWDVEISISRGGDRYRVSRRIQAP